MRDRRAAGFSGPAWSSPASSCDLQRRINLADAIRIGIAGYGNLGRGVELAVRRNPDMALVGIFTLWRVGVWYAAQRRANAGRPPMSTVAPFDRRKTLIALLVLTILTLTKNSYMASLSSYYTFFLIER